MTSDIEHALPQLPNVPRIGGAGGLVVDQNFRAPRPASGASADTMHSLYVCVTSNQTEKQD